MSTPRVSVLMNCFNGARYLRPALESVCDQTVSDWELLFWDNQSTDESASIVGEYRDARIRYLPAPMHTNLGEARRQACAFARGEWVGILDTDDLWLPKKLESHWDPCCLHVMAWDSNDFQEFLYKAINV